MIKSLHIICWDIPFPADYGGVIDVFFKLKFLHELDVKITLHCFQYGKRNPAKELEQYCAQIIYYPRQTGLKGLHINLPYIISSRNDKTLLENLCKDDAPILFEGIHSTYFLQHEKLRLRKKFLRTHNIEHDYYQQLGKNETDWVKQLYYYWESIRLKNYENNLEAVDGFIEIAEQDIAFFQKKYPTQRHLYCPGFQSYDHVTIRLGQGDYCLYHGNLSIKENENAALFLITEVFNDLKLPLIIAGKNPSKRLLSLENEFVKIISNPDDARLNELIQHAQINVLPSFQSTGLKLKLLHALFVGRFCVVNADMLVGTALHKSVSCVNNAIEFKQEIDRLMSLVFTENDMQIRMEELKIYSPSENSKQLIKFIFD